MRNPDVGFAFENGHIQGPAARLKSANNGLVHHSNYLLYSIAGEQGHWNVKAEMQGVPERLFQCAEVNFKTASLKAFGFSAVIA